ncbi:flagellar FliJ protein [Evansella vedderi]|uniref:Flagellar FliJ protein n=1 Tax=Evansella vedderi TaxID=38282 RepID=A0ABT9ZR39_9BACI|nr:flagellar export protein FliJ [Evansella vedderi]MDQ0253712.1 flagellar FliJ protein [Evansella vedderi]
MSFQFTLQKVLEVKENERSEAQAAYKSSLKKFEEIATKLYHILKKKEDLLATYEDSLNKGVSINHIQQTQGTLQYLQQEIDHLQRETQNARAYMNEKQRMLTVTNIELKKYEKMKEHKLEKYKIQQKVAENKFLDEISVQRYRKLT